MERWLVLPLVVAAGCAHAAETTPQGTGGSGGDTSTTSSSSSTSASSSASSSSTSSTSSSSSSTSSSSTSASSSSTTSASSSGLPGVCAPGEQKPCYDGPPATLGQGLCVGGTQTCSPQGDWFGCVGEVLPAAENCQTAADEDCDGLTPACAPGDVTWSRRFPVSQLPAYSYVFAARIDGHDDVVLLLGLIAPGTLDLGLQPVVGGPCGDTMVVAKLDGKTGATLWQTPVMGVTVGSAEVLAVASDDSIGVAVQRGSTCTMVCEGITATAANDVLVLDKTGHPQGFLPLPDAVTPHALAQRPGGFTLGGGSTLAVSFGNGVTLPAAAAGAGFVAALDAAGHATWATPLGIELHALDTDETGVTYATTVQSGSIFSNGTATMRVSSVSAAGAVGWSHPYTASNIVNFYGMPAVRAHGGSVVVGGALYADADFGFGAVTGNGYNSFLLLFDAAGNVKFGKWLDAQGDYPWVGVDPLGGFYLAAGFNGFGNRFWRLTPGPAVTSVWSRPGGSGPVAVTSAGDGVLCRTDITQNLAYVVEKYAR
jgi:hypothetical protein